MVAKIWSSVTPPFISLDNSSFLGKKHYKKQVDCLKRLEKYDDALILVNSLFKINNTPDDLFEIKYELLERTQADKTIIESFFKEWEANVAKTAEFYNSRACWFLERNFLDEAMEDAKKAIGIDVKYPLAYATLAETQASKGDNESFFSNLELAFVFNLKTHVTILDIPIHIYKKYKDNQRFKNLLKQYDVEAEFMGLLDKKEGK